MKPTTNTYFVFNKNFDYSESRIDLLASEFPGSDFIDEIFDQSIEVPLKKVVILFSTERSGSTFFCETLNQSGLCVMHEYMQPYNYMPVIAKRWNAIDNGKVNIEKFWLQLKRFRVTEGGVLGINLHGSHIYLFEQMRAYMGDVEIEYYYIKRRDIISQAISYEIASQNKAWSSEFSKRTNSLKYDYEIILQKLRRLEFDNLKVRIFIEKYNLSVDDFYLEDFVKNRIDFIFKNFAVDIGSNEVSLKKQADAVNTSWRKKFIKDFELMIEKPVVNFPKVKLIQRLKRYPIKLIKKYSKNGMKSNY